MAEIGRSFDELDKKIKQFRSDVKTTDAEIKSLDKSLKLNPGSVDDVRKKYALLSQNLQTNSEKLAALKQKQHALNNDLKTGTISQKEYDRQLKNVRKELDATEKGIKDLTNSLQGQNAAVREAKYTNLIDGLTKAEDKARKFSQAALAVVSALGLMMKSAINTGDELSDTATHFGTNVEELQLWSNRLGMLAKDQEAYTKALERIGSVQAMMTTGRGARYITFLKELGIAQEDLNGKTNGEAFELIYEALRNVTDEAERMTLAQGLLGDTGLEIAVIAGTQQEKINALDDALIKNGIITSEQAAAADEAANKMLELKQQFQAANAELLVALMPTFEALTELLKTAVIPIINKLSDWFGTLTQGQQKALMILMMIIVFLPKIISLGKGVISILKLAKAATLGQAAATGTLTAAAGPWLGVITAISLALLLLIKIIGWFIGASNDAVNSADNLLGRMDEIQTKAGSMGADVGYSAETTHNSNTKKTLDINLDVTATGDGTRVSKENAELIANDLYDKLSVDLLNQKLGEITR